MKKILALLACFVFLASAQSGNQTAVVSFSSSSGSVQIIAAPQPGTSLKIYKVVFALAATTDVKYVSGTGSNCGTGAVDLTGTMKTVSAIIDTPMGTNSPSIVLAPAQAFCINLSGSSTGGGYVVYGF